MRIWVWLRRIEGFVLRKYRRNANQRHCYMYSILIVGMWIVSVTTMAMADSFKYALDQTCKMLSVTLRKVQHYAVHAEYSRV